MELVRDARVWWKLWSIRLGALGTFITSCLILVPEWALEIWAVLPQEIKGSIPPRIMPMIGVLFFVLAMVARLIRQRSLDNARR